MIIKLKAQSSFVFFFSFFWKKRGCNIQFQFCNIRTFRSHDRRCDESVCILSNLHAVLYLHILLSLLVLRVFITPSSKLISLSGLFGSQLRHGVRSKVH